MESRDSPILLDCGRSTVNPPELTLPVATGSDTIDPEGKSGRCRGAKNKISHRLSRLAGIAMLGGRCLLRWSKAIVRICLAVLLPELMIRGCLKNTFIPLYQDSQT